VLGAVVRRVKPDGNFYTESVPYSCCNIDSTGPCIHDDVLKTYSRYDYNPAMKLTINTDGCSAVVADTLQTTLVGCVLIGLSVVAVSNRYGEIQIFGFWFGSFWSVLGSFPSPVNTQHDMI